MAHNKFKVKISSRASEILLGITLLAMVGFTRVYYGGPAGFMVVWKGGFGFKDTLVNLDEFSQIPRDESVKAHPGVLFQLEEMGLIDSPLNSGKKGRLHGQAKVPPLKKAPLDKTAATPANH